MIGRERALEIAHQAIRSVPADEVEVMLLAENFALTRYCNSSIHQNVERDDLLLSIRAIADDGIGQAYSSSSEPEALRLAGQQALQIARANPSPVTMSFSPGGEVAQLQTYYDTTAACGPMERAEAVRQMAGIAATEGFVIHGAFQTDRSEMAVVTTAGAEQYAPLTTAAIRLAVASEDGGTGFAEAISREVSQLLPGALARRATEKCRLNQHRVSLLPGEYTTILEELAVADLVRFLGTLGLNGLAVQEGRSFATSRFGEQLMDPRITLRDDPWDERGLVLPFDPEGTPKVPMDLIREGSVCAVVHDRTTAAEVGVQSTGHAQPPDPEAMMGYPAPTNIFLAGGDSSVDEMIANTERGVLVTRLHYTNSPDPRKVLVTGMTQDGTFLIQDGRISQALHNQRVHQSVLDMLNDVAAISARPELHRDWWCGGGISMQHGVVGISAHHVPALQVGRFRFIGESPVI